MRTVTILIVCFLAAGNTRAAEPETCAGHATYSRLDFWVGDWEVYVGEELVGTNRIEKTLDGCAILEHWQGASGGRGMSLFYVDDKGTWKQVWVTEAAIRPGGVKEKTSQPMPDQRQVRFQGRIHTDDSSSYLDRTTLTDLGNGEVRQVIEISTDEGRTWKSGFDAVYRRKETD